MSDGPNDDSPIEKERTDDSTINQIALSAEVYARVKLISEKRNCSLEMIIEDLVGRFLPAWPNEPSETTGTRPSATRDVMKDLPWTTWTRWRSR